MVFQVESPGFEPRLVPLSFLALTFKDTLIVLLNFCINSIKPLKVPILVRPARKQLPGRITCRYIRRDDNNTELYHLVFCGVP